MSDALFFDTVITHFNRQGSKFTLDEIARSLRISKRTIYEQYGNKEKILLLSVDRFFHSMKEEESAILQDESIDIIERIRRVTSLFPLFKIDFSRIEDLRIGYPEVYREILIQLDNNWENTFRLFQEAFDSGKLRPFDLETLKIILLGVFQEVIELEQSVQRQKVLSCVDLILDGYLIQ